MRVAQINSVSGVGSTGRIVEAISDAMAEQQIENRIFYGIGKTTYVRAQKAGGAFNIRSHQVLSRLTGRHGEYSKTATRLLLRELELFSPDVVHLHNIHGFYLNYKMLFDWLRRWDKPVIWTLHDCWAFTGHCAYYDYASCEKWKTGCYQCPNLREYPGSWFIDGSRHNYSAKQQIFRSLTKLTIFTPSQWLKDQVQESFLSEYPCIVINNGVDVQRFRPIETDIRRQLEIRQKYMVLCIAANLDPRKGVSYMLKLAEDLGEDYRVVLLGANKAQIERLPVSVTAVPRTSSIEELAALYSAADVYVNPTLEDNFPTTNLESLACGTPVVAFNSGGACEAVEEDVGMKVKSKDYSGMLDAIRSICRKGKQSYAKACRERAIAKYQDDECYAKYVDLYMSGEDR